jgi:3-oxoacyl-[acyl-carrier protein] reductase
MRPYFCYEMLGVLFDGDRVVIDPGLDQRVVLVTNAASAIGQAVARLFAAQGAWIAVHFFTAPQEAKRLVDDLRSEGGRAMLAPGSLHDQEGVWSLIERIEMEWEQVDVLIHTAALSSHEEPVPILQHLMKEMQFRMCVHPWGRIVTFNMEGVLSSHEPHVLINNINVSSVQAIDPAAKFALFLGSSWNQCISDQSFTIAESDIQKKVR